MLLNARRIVLEENKTQLILLAIEDVTEKKGLEKRKDEFLGMASHESKNPLTSIKVYLQISGKRLDKANLIIQHCFTTLCTKFISFGFVNLFYSQ